LFFSRGKAKAELASRFFWLLVWFFFGGGWSPFYVFFADLAFPLKSEPNEMPYVHSTQARHPANETAEAYRFCEINAKCSRKKSPKKTMSEPGE
jgi:hypothetical protein